MKLRSYLLILVYCCLSTFLHAQVKLPALISDGMVLQRNVALNIWGWAKPGENIRITFRDKTYTTVTSGSGKWTVQLEKSAAGGPFQLLIKASNTITLNDVLVGDVWLCSGQSNMAFKMDGTRDKYTAIIASSLNPNIRQLNVAEKYSFSAPLEDVKTDGWKIANPQNVLKFTAVGYFFAKEINEKYKVPVGLILSAWGGTPAEAWMSEDALKAFPKYMAVADQLKDSVYLKEIKTKDARAKDDWYNITKNDDLGFATNKWFAPDLVTADWKTLQLPGFFETEGVGNIDGVVWFRKEIEVPTVLAGKKAVLYLGNLIDQDTSYVNGVKVGSSPNRYAGRKYNIPENVLKAGKNVITVRLINRSGPGGFIKDKQYELVIGKQKIALSGLWQYKIGVVTKPQPTETIFPYQPLGLYNAMINPLLNYKINGVLWYQGEANSGKGFEYRTLFPALITDWRTKFKQGDFPFLYVQLANYMETKDQPAESKWAELREAQLMALSVAKTGMAVITDIGEWNDVHPLNKEDVGKRLALAAQKVAYGDQNVVFSGPLYKSYHINGNQITISFTGIGSGLLAKGGIPLKYFAIAGADKKFVWAQAKIVGDKVIVWSDAVKDPTAVRYAWADNPEGANLYNKEGLPATSFRTDQ